MKAKMVIEFYDPRTEKIPDISPPELEKLAEKLEDFILDEGYYAGVEIYPWKSVTIL